MVKNNCRQVIDPNQTATSRAYQFKNTQYNFDLKHGYLFSYDKDMDEAVEYFTEELGFKLNELTPNGSQSVKPSFKKIVKEEIKATEKKVEEKKQPSKKK